MGSTRLHCWHTNDLLARYSVGLHAFADHQSHCVRGCGVIIIGHRGLEKK
jgi:hypothetical protein